MIKLKDSILVAILHSHSNYTNTNTNSYCYYSNNYYYNYNNNNYYNYNSSDRSNTYEMIDGLVDSIILWSYLSLFQLIASRAVALLRKVTCKSIHLKMSQLYFNLCRMTNMFHSDRLLSSTEFEVEAPLHITFWILIILTYNFP